MTIENDNLIEVKLKQQQQLQHQKYNGFISMSKLLTNYKLSSPPKTSSSSSPLSLSSPSSSTTSLTSSSYSLTSGFSSNINSTKTDNYLFDDSFSKRPTLLSEFTLNTTTTNNNNDYYAPTLSSAKLSLFSRDSNMIEHFTELSTEQQTNLIDKWVPFSEIQKKIFVPDADPKKFIFNYNSPNLSAKKELNYLGIVDVNPDEYTQKYGAELKSASDLPKYILDIKTPDNLRLAADVNEFEIHELEGDVEALKHVDLEREDLTIYKQYLKRIGIFA